MHYRFFVFSFIFAIVCYVLLPITQTRILLPLDLLMSNYKPWLLASQIFIKNPYLQDSVIQMYPWKHFVFQSFQHGIIPFWNPYQNMGMPFMASMKPMVFYPLNILYILGEVRAWNALLISQLCLSIIFAYVLARDFKLAVVESIFVSLGIACNSFMFGLLEFGSDGHAIIWFPIFLLCAKRFLEKQQGRYLFLLSIVVASSILAGQLQYTAYGLLLLGGFTVFYGRYLKTKLLNYFFLGLSVFCGVGISMVQLFPTLELFASSLRGVDVAGSYDIFGRGLIRFYHLFKLLSPDFFGNPVSRDLTLAYIETSGYFGIIPLFFCIYAIIFLRTKALVKFFSIIFISVLLLSLQGIGNIVYLLKIPIITSGSADRIFILALFSGAILAGFGLQEFVKNKKRPRVKSVLVFSATFYLIIILWFLVSFFHHETTYNFLKNMLFGVVLVGIFSSMAIYYIKQKTNHTWLHRLFPWLLVLLTFFDLFRLGYRTMVVSNVKFLYPEYKVLDSIRNLSAHNLSRTYGLDEPELDTYFHVYSVETYNPLYLLRNGKLLSALQGNPNTKLPVNKLYLWSEGSDFKYAIDFLGVSYLVTETDANPSINYLHSPALQGHFNIIQRTGQHDIFLNDSPFPRFGLYYEAQIITHGDDILDTIAKRSIDLRKKIILEEKLPLQLEKGTGSAQVISYGVNTQKFLVKTDKPALFYISDTFFSGWTVLVNKKVDHIYRANYNLRAVLVPKGESTIEFSYLPTHFWWGVWISVGSFFSILLISFKFVFRK